MILQDTMTMKERVTRVARNIRDGIRILAINVALRFIRMVDYPERRLYIQGQWDDGEFGDKKNITEFIDDDWLYLTQYHLKELW